MESDRRSKRLRLAFLLGQTAQGLVMGTLLFFAILGLFALSGNVTAFRYQGY